MDILIKNAIKPQNSATAMKTDKNENSLDCLKKTPDINPAKEIDHQGRTKPIENANIAVTIIEIKNFIIYVSLVVTEMNFPLNSIV